MFAFLLVEKNIDWYKKLLLQTLGGERELNINPKNCIGTVLSINGFRKYFCVYHAKHPENNIPLVINFIVNDIRSYLFKYFNFYFHLR